MKMRRGMVVVRFFREEREEWRLPGLLYTDDLASCDELEKDILLRGVRE